MVVSLNDCSCARPVNIKDREFSSDSKGLLRKHDALFCNGEYMENCQEENGC
jgi:hypothetical protein